MVDKYYSKHIDSWKTYEQKLDKCESEQEQTGGQEIYK